MAKTVTDDDIRKFIAQNLHEYPSQIALMQAAVKLILPKENRADGCKRLVQLCLEEFNVLSNSWSTQTDLTAFPAIRHAPEQ